MKKWMKIQQKESKLIELFLFMKKYIGFVLKIIFWNPFGSLSLKSYKKIGF